MTDSAALLLACLTAVAPQDADVPAADLPAAGSARLHSHTSHRPVAGKNGIEDHWDLAFQRSRNVMQYLVEELGLDPKRTRMSVAGPNEPAHIGTDEEKLRENSRVEVYLLDEVVSDSVGTNEELQGRFVEDPTL